MNETTIKQGFGWFSVGLGAFELLAPRRFGRLVGVEGRAGLVRLFGLREIGAGVGLLSPLHPTPWMWARVAGDALDAAVLVSAATAGSNPRRGAARVALGIAVGCMALDVIFARRVQT